MDRLYQIVALLIASVTFGSFVSGPLAFPLVFACLVAVIYVLQPAFDNAVVFSIDWVLKYTGKAA